MDENKPFTIWLSDDGRVRIDCGELHGELSVETALALADALKKRFRTRPNTEKRTRWTPERISRLRDMYARGMTAIAIAEALATSRLAITSRIAILGIANRNPKNRDRMRGTQRAKNGVTNA